MSLRKAASVVASDLGTQKVAHHFRLRVMFNRPQMTWFEAGRNEWKTERVQTIVHGQICLSRPGPVDGWFSHSFPQKRAIFEKDCRQETREWQTVKAKIALASLALWSHCRQARQSLA